MRDNYLTGLVPGHLTALYPASWFDNNCFSNVSTVRRQASCAPAPAASVSALVDLYNATGGGSRWVNRTSWLIGDPCINSWHGITCTRAIGSEVATVT